MLIRFSFLIGVSILSLVSDGMAQSVIQGPALPPPVPRNRSGSMPQGAAPSLSESGITAAPRGTVGREALDPLSGSRVAPAPTPGARAPVLGSGPAMRPQAAPTRIQQPNPQSAAPRRAGTPVADSQRAMAVPAAPLVQAPNRPQAPPSATEPVVSDADDGQTAIMVLTARRHAMYRTRSAQRRYPAGYYFEYQLSRVRSNPFILINQTGSAQWRQDPMLEVRGENNISAVDRQLENGGYCVRVRSLGIRNDSGAMYPAYAVTQLIAPGACR